MGERLALPRHYFIAESDPDAVILCRNDGSFVAAFSTTGATRGGIVETAKEDYRRLLGEGHMQFGGCAVLLAAGRLRLALPNGAGEQDAAGGGYER